MYSYRFPEIFPKNFKMPGGNQIYQQNRNPAFDSLTSFRLEFSILLTVLSSRSACIYPRFLPSPRNLITTDTVTRRLSTLNGGRQWSLDEEGRTQSGSPRGGNDPVPLILRIHPGGSRNGQSPARPLFPPFLSQWPRFLPVPTPLPLPFSPPVVLSPPSASHDSYLGR